MYPWSTILTMAQQELTTTARHVDGYVNSLLKDILPTKNFFPVYHQIYLFCEGAGGTGD